MFANVDAFVYDGLQNFSYTVLPFNVSGNDSADDYDYDYDYDDSLSSVLLWELVPVCIAYGLTFMLGVTGNVLVVVSIVRSRAMQTVTNVFLVSLASADLMLVLLCVPIKVRNKERQGIGLLPLPWQNMERMDTRTSLSLSVCRLFFCLFFLSFYLCPRVCLYVCVSMCLCVCMSVCLCVCLSVYLCICVSVYLCICVSVYLCICVSVSVYMCI
ncbi:hypothetical protein NP493_232g02001 [Ridgeia piscesae]|uniref:G-protein coupled receptors family 1 profile domain-containing protein n=1 Tax=Ridgeia piscesae TaxID=27915 RepID=A0AAD9UDP5_RIDPI|nr:hypothetical protein NP493_232g02001 [Ridgeia piscesae]